MSGLIALMQENTHLRREIRVLRKRVRLLRDAARLLHSNFKAFPCSVLDHDREDYHTEEEPCPVEARRNTAYLEATENMMKARKLKEASK